jgi:S1-C subfamily serine protease
MRRALLAAGALLGLAPLAAHAGLPEVVAAARGAVLPVGTYDALDSPRFSFRGSGFIVDDGLTLVTNAHVLPEAAPEKTLVLLLGGARGGAGGGPSGGNGGNGDSRAETRVLSLLVLDRERDLVLLRVSGAPLPRLRLAPPDSAREGQAVALIGFPVGGVLGFSPVTHHGIVSSITPIRLPPPNARALDAAAVSRLRQGAFDILQLDATAYPGNSGGPLLDAETGEVLGVINMVLVKSNRESALSNPTGISYAIPVAHIHALLTRR